VKGDLAGRVNGKRGRGEKIQSRESESDVYELLCILVETARVLGRELFVLFPYRKMDQEMGSNRY